MKTIKLFIGLLVVAALFASCATSDKVVTGNFIQKRKYNKGFYVSAKGKKEKEMKFKNTGIVITNEVAKNETISNFSYKSKKESISDNTFENTLIASTDESFIPKKNNFQLDYVDVDKNLIEKLEVKLENSKNKFQKKIQEKAQKLNLLQKIDSDEPKTEGLGLAGFITGLVGLFVLGIVLGIISIIFGAISLGKISKQPEKYKGKGFAITSLILGILDVFAFFIVIALIL